MRLPALFDAVDQESNTAQKLFLRVRMSEYLALAAAAGFSEIPGAAVWGAGPIIALVLFVVALFLRVSYVAEKAEKRWYEARAAAESIKSSAWQFAVGGEAYRREDEESPDRFKNLLHQMLDGLHRLEIPSSSTGAAVTSDMLQLRQRSRAERIDAYRSHRVADQLKWYSKKADENRRWARNWRLGLIVVEAVGVLLGLGRALDYFDVDWLGILAASAAGLSAWQQTKKYSELAEAYSVTSHDVTIVGDSLAHVADEQAWAQAVHDAEAAFSREHTLWLARRQGPT